MTKIEWTHYQTPDGKLIRGSTWNPIVGCSRAGYSPAGGGHKVAHPGCDHCYAETFCGRGLPGVCSPEAGEWDGTIDFRPERLLWPFQRSGFRPRADGHRRIVFVASLSDMGHPNVPDEVWKAINGAMILSPWNIYKDLTKRPEIQAERLLRWRPEECVDAFTRMLSTDAWRGALPGSSWSLARNIHRYVSVSDQATADALIPELLKMPASVRGVSYEPAIGPVDWSRHLQVLGDFYLRTVDHVIIGGESGPGARWFDLQWARDTIKACRRAGIPVYVKQLGALAVEVVPDHTGTLYDRHLIAGSKGEDWEWWPEDLKVREHVREWI